MHCQTPPILIPIHDIPRATQNLHKSRISVRKIFHSFRWEGVVAERVLVNIIGRYRLHPGMHVASGRFIVCRCRRTRACHRLDDRGYRPRFILVQRFGDVEFGEYAEGN